MKRSIIVCLFLILLAGCAAYKELSPDPEIVPLERGYVELKNDKEYFKLENGKKYFIKFAKPQQDKYYLVLTMTSKAALISYVASAFDDGAPMEARIADEMPDRDTLLVSPVDTRVPTYFWVVDSVRYDLDLKMHYRYVPRWRFTFETKYGSYKETLAENRTDRTVYEAVGPGFRFDGTKVREAMNRLETRIQNLTTLQKELVALGDLFPPEIVSRRDTAYENYLALKSDLNGELNFQDAYRAVLTIDELDRSSRGNAVAFLDGTPTLLGFFKQQDRYRPQVTAWGRSLVLNRLPEAVSYYESKVRAKSDLKKFALQPPLDLVPKLYRACNTRVPEDYDALVAYVERFNTESQALQSAQARLSDIDRAVQRSPAWKSDSLHASCIANAAAARSALAETQIARFDRGKNYAVTALLADEISREASKAAGLQTLYERGRGVAAAVVSSSWPAAESQLQSIFLDQEMGTVPDVAAQRLNLVSGLESEIFTGVKSQTEQRVDAFVALHTTTIDNVAALYKDSAFTPMYQLSFSYMGPQQVAQERKQIDDYLNRARHFQFPENAIRANYREFVRDPSVRGVDRARAIVEHGKEYRGNDRQLRDMVNECDVNMPKWITRPKDYRKVIAFPITSNRQGTNEYMFRLLLQIPSDAEFPVFDVNIKLPQDLVAKAKVEQWYKEITINKKPIKNEGRFRITAPTPETNYESLITPVQMDKGGQNILEVRFQYPGYRVFEVSAMAQVPIIRKN